MKEREGLLWIETPQARGWLATGDRPRAEYEATLQRALAQGFVAADAAILAAMPAPHVLPAFSWGDEGPAAPKAPQPTRRLDLYAIVDGRTIEAEVRFGHVLVQVPEEGVDVHVTSDVEGGGESVLFGDRTDGSDETVRDVGSSTEIDLDLKVFFGQVEVETKEAVR